MTNRQNPNEDPFKRQENITGLGRGHQINKGYYRAPVRTEPIRAPDQQFKRPGVLTDWVQLPDGRWVKRSQLEQRTAAKPPPPSPRAPVAPPSPPPPPPPPTRAIPAPAAEEEEEEEWPEPYDPSEEQPESPDADYSSEEFDDLLRQRPFPQPVAPPPPPRLAFPQPPAIRTQPAPPPPPPPPSYRSAPPPPPRAQPAPPPPPPPPRAYRAQPAPLRLPLQPRPYRSVPQPAPAPPPPPPSYRSAPRLSSAGLQQRRDVEDRPTVGLGRGKSIDKGCYRAPVKMEPIRRPEQQLKGQAKDKLSDWVQVGPRNWKRRSELAAQQQPQAQQQETEEPEEEEDEPGEDTDDESFEWPAPPSSPAPEESSRSSILSVDELQTQQGIRAAVERLLRLNSEMRWRAIETVPRQYQLLLLEEIAGCGKEEGCRRAR